MGELFGFVNRIWDAIKNRVQRRRAAKKKRRKEKEEFDKRNGPIRLDIKLKPPHMREETEDDG